MKRRIRKKLRKREFTDPWVRTRLHVMLAPAMRELLSIMELNPVIRPSDKSD